MLLAEYVSTENFRILWAEMGLELEVFHVKWVSCTRMMSTK